jgi:hypothetical protein
MSLNSAKTYLLSLPINKTDDFWKELVTKAVAFEVLDPYELEEDWVEVRKVTSTDTGQEGREEMLLLDKVITSFQQKSLFSPLLDYRHEANAADLQMNLARRQEILEIATKLGRLKEIKEEESDLQNLLRQFPKKEFLFGLNISNLISPFNTFVGQIIDQFELDHPQARQVEPSRPQLDYLLLGNQEALIFNTADKALVMDFIKLHTEERGHNLQNLDQLTSNFAKEKESIRNFLNKAEIDPVKPHKNFLKDLSIAHAILQMRNRMGLLKSNAFTVSHNPASHFAFCSVSPFDIEKFQAACRKFDVVFEDFQWKRDIVLWHQSGGLNAFQQVVQALGTIGTKETDPTKAVSFFFILFFAMAVNDALYGLFLVLFCGYFLYFQKIKHAFKSIFNLFFLSGLGALGYGALMNSWGGNLLEKTPLNHFLEMFQLIHPLKPESHSPVNTFLRENGGLSPIVALLAFSVIIGLAHIFTAYFIKINTSLKKNDKIEVLNEISWIGFLVFIGFSAFFAVIGSPLTTFGLAGLGLSTLGLFTFNHGKNLGGKILSGAVRIYELVAFFADMLSYTRLIAIGLTGAIIADVINLLGNLVYTSFNPIIGFVLAALVLVTGHAFNLVVAMFGAYINPLRLHYVEFLPKFFKGEGRSLRPWDFNFKHLRLQD